ncbi:hypothetical protein BLOT_007322 [Blomia tropicalis]|nr:hypothetical protein BLOT_007322 [Blomia tropicalis]
MFNIKQSCQRTSRSEANSTIDGVSSCTESGHTTIHVLFRFNGLYQPQQIQQTSTNRYHQKTSLKRILNIAKLHITKSTHIGIQLF